MKIGDVDLPCVSSFDAAAAKKSTETIAPLGTDLHVVAEFDSDPIQLEISGVLFKKYSGTKTADEYAEDLAALASRKSMFNYVHEVQGRSGFVVVENSGVDPRNATKSCRDFSISGIFLPISQYWGKVDTDPVVRSNSFGIMIEDCICWSTIPLGSSYATTGSTREVDSEYGTLKQTSGSFVNFMPAGEMDNIGEVQVFDDSTRIFSAAHLISGTLTLKNGLYSVVIDKDSNTITVSYWSGSEYTKIDAFTVDAFTFLYLKTCRPDLVEVVLSSGAELLLQIGRPPMISADTLTCSELSPEEQSTGTDNYLVLTEGLYVASDQALAIVSEVISGSGKKWVLAASDVSQEAKNCLVNSREKWYVERRW